MILSQIFKSKIFTLFIGTIAVHVAFANVDFSKMELNKDVEIPELDTYLEKEDGKLFKIRKAPVPETGKKIRVLSSEETSNNYKCGFSYPVLPSKLDQTQVFKKTSSRMRRMNKSGKDILFIQIDFKEQDLDSNKNVYISKQNGVDFSYYCFVEMPQDTTVGLSSIMWGFHQYLSSVRRLEAIQKSSDSSVLNH